MIFKFAGSKWRESGSFKIFARSVSGPETLHTRILDTNPELEKYTQPKRIGLCIRKFDFSIGNASISCGPSSHSMCPGRERILLSERKAVSTSHFWFFYVNAMHQQSDFEFSDVILGQETSVFNKIWIFKRWPTMVQNLGPLQTFHPAYVSNYGCACT